eukprot:TRINITY_DN2924_c6_g1_i2.p1 TRINITY_DN2924_c6_g1~~TRINITY_DN2924_c6_g1_i2.p1  ORF type:complete len:364 (+),score=31.33 TRINITY_DN2924_c6_g1_i2:135-1094(+)
MERKMPAKLSPELLARTNDPLHPEGPQEIVKGFLYLGSEAAATNLAVLRALGITHVLVAALELKPRFKEAFNYCHVMIRDVPTTDLEPLLFTCVQFIDEARATNGRVLVHCVMGKSRSASVVIAYLMQTQGLSFRDAYNRVVKLRSVVHPNIGFSTQLQSLERVWGIVAKGAAPVEAADALTLATERLRMLSVRDQAMESKLRLYVRQTVKFYPRGALGALSQAAAEQDSFSCLHCRELLFLREDIGHQSQNKKKNCSNYFLKSVIWMPAEQMAENEGDILCPRCEYPLGRYHWSGTDCSCGDVVVPSFAIAKTDVSSA